MCVLFKHLCIWKQYSVSRCLVVAVVWCTVVEIFIASPIQWLDCPEWKPTCKMCHRNVTSERTGIEAERDEERRERIGETTQTNWILDSISSANAKKNDIVYQCVVECIQRFGYTNTRAHTQTHRHSHTNTHRRNAIIFRFSFCSVVRLNEWTTFWNWNGMKMHLCVQNRKRKKKKCEPNQPTNQKERREKKKLPMKRKKTEENNTQSN